jgi:chromosome segregation ATPase
LNQKQAAAKVTVDRLHKRNEIIARIEKLKIRIPIARYTAAQAEHRRLKEVRNAAKAEEERLKERDQPLRDRAEAYNSRKHGKLRLYEKAKTSLTNTMDKIKAREEKSVNFEDEALAMENEYMRVKKQAGKKKATLEEMQTNITKLERGAKQAQQKLERLGPDDTVKVEVRVLFKGELIAGGC